MLRGGNPNSEGGFKVGGCAMPLSLEVSENQRKKDLALGISVRTSVGDSEEVNRESVCVCMCMCISPSNPHSSTPLPTHPPTHLPLRTQSDTGSMTFVPGTQMNVTVPIVVCGEQVLGLIVRVVGNSTETLLLDSVVTNNNGDWRRSIADPCAPQLRINHYKTLIEVGAAAR